LKLGDFGLATFVDNPLNQKCGSPVYVAPEVLEDNRFLFYATKISTINYY